MTYRIFQYRLPIDGQPDDLNRWVAANRVVNVVQHLVQNPGGALLVFVVETTAGTASRQTEPRVDYKEKLSPEDFEVFSRLRNLRKEIAEREGVPVYAVFTNAQLAGMAENRVTSAEELRAIEGVGQARVDKHAASFLALLAETRKSEEGDE